MKEVCSCIERLKNVNTYNFHETSIQHNPKQIPHMISLDISKDFLNDMENNWARWKL